MTIPLDLAARIERLFTVEHWRVGTIARQLHVHRDTVRRVLREHNVAPRDVPLRPSHVDPYRSFIRETLEKYPTLTARRLHDMVCERGYTGRPDHFRHLVATMRPRRPAEAYLRLRTLPGEQMQLAWGHFGHLQIGRARRPLMGFVAVLSYSRRVFLRFCLNAQMDSFLRGHVEAFTAFGGLGRTLLYDNLKSVVLERVGDAIRFNPEFLAFAKHYRFEPRPVAVARGNQKGRVERQIDLRPQELLRRSQVRRRGRPERAGLPLVRGPGVRSTLAAGRLVDRTRGVRCRATLPARASRSRLRPGPAAGRRGGQDALGPVGAPSWPFALRPERLHGAAYPRATYLVGAGR